MLYHHHDYGGTVPVPGSDLAISVNVRVDNSGPHTIDEIDLFIVSCIGVFQMRS